MGTITCASLNPCPLQLCSSSMKRWTVFPYPLNLGWPCDLFRLVVYGRNDSVQVMSLHFTRLCILLPALLDLCFLQMDKANFLKDSRPHGPGPSQPPPTLPLRPGLCEKAQPRSTKLTCSWSQWISDACVSLRLEETLSWISLKLLAQQQHLI